MSETVLQELLNALDDFRPRKRWWRRFARRSAVALILRGAEGGPEVLMIKRAEREGDPWSGHMAFPGGHMDTDDSHSFAAAQRESLEEVGLDLEADADCVGRLSDILARPALRRRPMVVTPFVFFLHTDAEFDLNHEVDEVIWVPLSFLRDRNHRKRMVWRRGKLKINLPCYFYQGRRIWGLSLAMLDELLAIPLPYSAGS